MDWPTWSSTALPESSSTGLSGLKKTVSSKVMNTYPLPLVTVIWSCISSSAI